MVVLVNLVAHHQIKPFKEDTLRASLNKQAEMALLFQLLAMSLGLLSTLVGADAEVRLGGWGACVAGFSPGPGCAACRGACGAEALEEEESGGPDGRCDGSGGSRSVGGRVDANGSQ